MKKEFNTPEISIVRIEDKDIICASTCAGTCPEYGLGGNYLES